VGETAASAGGGQAGAAPVGGAPDLAARPRWPQAELGERILQVAVAGVCAAALVLGVILTPSRMGTGTHTVFGLPPCGMLLMTGRPCPTCGVTTSYVLAAHGRFYDSLVNQPFGLAVFLGVVAGLVGAIGSLATGRSWWPLARPSIVISAASAMLALLLASWAYKWATL